MWPRSTQRLKAARKLQGWKWADRGSARKCSGQGQGSGLRSALHWQHRTADRCWVFLSPNFAEEGAGRRVLGSVGGEGEDAWVTPGSCQLGPLIDESARMK